MRILQSDTLLSGICSLLHTHPKLKNLAVPYFSIGVYGIYGASLMTVSLSLIDCSLHLIFVYAIYKPSLMIVSSPPLTVIFLP